MLSILVGSSQLQWVSQWGGGGGGLYSICTWGSDPELPDCALLRRSPLRGLPAHPALRLQGAEEVPQGEEEGRGGQVEGEEEDEEQQQQQEERVNKLERKKNAADFK